MVQRNVRVALEGNMDRRRGGVVVMVTDHFLARKPANLLVTIATAANDDVREGQRSKLTWKLVPQFNNRKYNLASGGTQAHDL